MLQYPRFHRLGVLSLMGLLAAGCVINLDADQVVVRDEKTFTVGPGADLTLETFDGSIEVRSWDRPDIQVEVQKRGPDRDVAAALEVKSSQEGDKVRVEAPAPRVMHKVIGIGNSSPSVSFVVRVPKQLKLIARTRDGSIAVENVNGTVELRSGDGSIKGERITGDLNARTDDGSMRIVDANGRVSVESGDGSIHIDGRVDDVHAQTRDGSIVIEADEGSAMKQDWEVSTGDGSITFRVPQSFSAEIEADSRDGNVSTDVSGLQSTDNHGRETLRGRLGSGGHILKLRSGDGSIRVVTR